MNGKKLPNLTLENSQGGVTRIPEDLQGKWTILYFYPKDDTPGCTAQACSYRDHLANFNDSGIQVLGVSQDDLDSHGAFRDKYSLNFPLLSDNDRKLSMALGVYGEQEWKGEKFMGLSRDTFLIGPDVTIRKVWRKVDPRTTMQDTLDAARAEMRASA